MVAGLEKNCASPACASCPGTRCGSISSCWLPGIIEDAPASYITSFHLPAERAEAASALVKRFPNLTLIDVEAVLRQLQTVVGQVRTLSSSSLSLPCWPAASCFIPPC
jgi:hypothetical protein